MLCYVEEKVRVCDWALAFSFITNIFVYEFFFIYFFFRSLTTFVKNKSLVQAFFLFV